MTHPNPKLVGFRTWARSAMPGEVYIYHRSDFQGNKDLARSPRAEELFTHARRLSDAGLAMLYQRRSGYDWEYCARRTSLVCMKTLDKVSETVTVAPTIDFLVEHDRYTTGGRPRKAEIVE